MLQQKFFIIMIILYLLCSFCSCDSDPDPGSKINNIITKAEPEEKENNINFQNINWNENINLDFVQIKIGNSFNSGSSMTESNISREVSSPNNKLFWISGSTIKNLSGNPYDIFDFAGKVQIIFDNKYNYNGSLMLMNGSELSPLETRNLYIYTEVPPEILNTYKTVSVRFGFNDNFASSIIYPDWTGYKYRYQLVASK